MKHDIFLSYSRKDRERVQPLVQLLETQGWSVWWDVQIDLGVRFGKYIDEQLSQSRLVVVVWSNTSIDSEWVIEEASEGKDRKILIPIKIDDIRPPLGFRRRQVVNFLNWQQEDSEVISFLNSIKDKFGTNDLPKPIKPSPKQVTQPPIIQNFQEIDDKNGILTDRRDGQTYKTIKIGNQTWMAENLDIEVEGSFCYDNDPENCKKYGRLYTWEAAKKACPKGWHIPSDAEWKVLMNKMGGYYDYGGNGIIGDPEKSYKSLIKGGDSNFSALLGGRRYSSGEFYDLSENGSYWSAAERNAVDAWSYIFDSVAGEVNRNGNNKTDGFSCRCLKD